jgi:hypothetical protein
MNPALTRPPGGVRLNVARATSKRTLIHPLRSTLGQTPRHAESGNVSGHAAPVFLRIRTLPSR